MIEKETKESLIHKDFFYGRKTISVNINMVTFTASVRFGTRGEWWRKKELGETTIIFLLADSYLQEIADRIDHNICLIFDTCNINLRAWARSRIGLLGFDSIEPENIDSYRVTVKKSYFPAKIE